MWLGLAVGMWVLVGGSTVGWALALWQVHRSLPVVPPRRPPDLGLYPYAFLCGSRRRTAQTALAALHLAGRIHVDGGRIVCTDPTAPPPADPVEAAALAACLPGGAGKALKVERRAKRSAPVRRIADDLAGSGLVAHPRLLARIEAWRLAMIMTACAAVWFVLVALMVWPARHSGQAGRAAAITAATPLTIALLALVKPVPAGPTDAGRLAIGAHSPPAGPETAVLHDVAAHGLEAPGMPPALAHALRRPEPSAFQPDDPAGLGGL